MGENGAKCTVVDIWDWEESNGVGVVLICVAYIKLGTVAENVGEDCEDGIIDVFALTWCKTFYL